MTRKAPYKQGDVVSVNGVEYKVVNCFSKKTHRYYIPRWFVELSDGTTVQEERIDKPSFVDVKYLFLDSDCSVKKRMIKIPYHVYRNGHVGAYIAHVLSVDKEQVQYR